MRDRVSSETWKTKSLVNVIYHHEQHHNYYDYKIKINRYYHCVFAFLTESELLIGRI
jgi:hypothetical protein